ncbi:MAG: hypothetical protein KKD18_03590 [Nanoarchaeota archaeon]|nr:hypothetical protein [Nanoarchaeota archaeon]MBU0977473.1 hypothetical protein [Nanoarchaeota archaeon]
MQTLFKRHQKVRLLTDPDPEYTEYHTENTDEEQVPIRKGMTGEINLILPNGQYHIRVLDDQGRELAYVVMSEEFLEAL